MAKLTLTALALSMQPNLNKLLVKAATADNLYVTGGVQLDISPGKILDPSSLGVNGPSLVPPVPPGVFSSSLGGYIPQIVPTTGGLSGYKLQFWTSGGTELAAGAYPGAISGGDLVLDIEYTQ